MSLLKQRQLPTLVCLCATLNSLDETVTGSKGEQRNGSGPDRTSPTHYYPPVISFTAKTCLMHLADDEFNDGLVPSGH